MVIPTRQLHPLSRARRGLLPLLAAIALGLSSALHAGSVTEALELHAAGRSEQATRLLQPLAEAGDPEAQFNLGVLLERADPQLSARWYARAARAGDARAAYNLAHLYLSARGLPPDPEAAREAFARAAELGLASARFNLAMMLERGVGGAADDRAAAEQFRRAAEDGEARAALHLAERALAAGDLPAAWRWAQRVEALAGDAQPGHAGLRDTLEKGLRRVRGRVVNLRRGPGKQHAVVAQLKRGDQVLELAREGGWVSVALAQPAKGGADRGWIFARLLER